MRCGFTLREYCAAASAMTSAVAVTAACQSLPLWWHTAPSWLQSSPETAWVTAQTLLNGWRMEDAKGETSNINLVQKARPLQPLTFSGLLAWLMTKLHTYRTTKSASLRVLSSPTFIGGESCAVVFAIAVLLQQTHLPRMRGRSGLCTAICRQRHLHRWLTSVHDHVPECLLQLAQPHERLTRYAS